MKNNFPKDIMIEVTNECNLKCITCYSHQDKRERKYIEKDIFKKIIDEIPNKEDKTISLYNYGEPLMHKHLSDFIKYTKDKGVKNIKVATNGTFLTIEKSLELIKSGLDYLSISIDGTTQNIYEKFRRGGNLNQIIQNIHKLVTLKEKIGKGPIIEIQFIIMSHNENQIENIKNLAKKLKVDILRYKTVLIKENKWNYLIPSNKKYTRYNENINKNYCNKPKKGIVINVDGTVIPCCYITDKKINKYKLGNIKENNLKNIYFSIKSQDFIEKVSTDKNKIDYCKNCQEGNLNLDYKVIILNKNIN